MIRGACLCGAVSFEIDPSSTVLFNNCYCTACRRASGAGFVSQLQVRVDSFHWLGGEQRIARYESSPGIFRAFCRTCGSRLPMSGRDLVPVPAGLLESDPGIAPEVNMHLSTKPQWALVDESMHCLQDQGSDEFWNELMESKRSGA